MRTGLEQYTLKIMKILLVLIQKRVKKKLNLQNLFVQLAHLEYIFVDFKSGD